MTRVLNLSSFPSNFVYSRDKLCKLIKFICQEKLVCSNSTKLVKKYLLYIVCICVCVDSPENSFLKDVKWELCIYTLGIFNAVCNKIIVNIKPVSL